MRRFGSVDVLSAPKNIVRRKITNVPYLAAYLAGLRNPFCRKRSDSKKRKRGEKVVKEEEEEEEDEDEDEDKAEDEDEDEDE